MILGRLIGNEVSVTREEWSHWNGWVAHEGQGLTNMKMHTKATSS